MLETNQVYAAMGEQPLFKYAVRRIRWAGTVEQLRRYNWRVAVIVHVLIVGLWLLTIYNSWTLYSTIYNQTGSIRTYYATPSYVSEQGFTFIAFLMLASIGLDIILDFACLVFALNSIGGEVSAGRWDLLRMTPIIEERIIAAKHGLAQVRAWRVMALVLYTRVAAVALLLLHVFLLPIFTGGPSPFEVFRYDVFNPLLGLITIVIFLAVYVIEPVWRMRAMAAVGIAISARVYNIAFAFLTAFAVMVVVWIVQAIIMGIIGWLTVQIVATFFITVFMCGVLSACIATAYIVRAFYNTLEGWALGYATRRIYEAARQ